MLLVRFCNFFVGVQVVSRVETDSYRFPYFSAENLATLLRPEGYVVGFFLEFLQCSFILKFCHNVATDHVNV
jgi:hypothetical protein